MSYTEVIPLEIRQGMSIGGSYLLLLALPKDGREIPVVIGDSEAQAIIMAQERIDAQRPMTHQLMTNVMKEYGLTVKQVSIDRFEEGIYYSTLTVSDGFNEKQIDSRTSDAVVLALMHEAPVMASDSVIAATAIEPLLLESDITTGDNIPTESLEQMEQQLQDCLEQENYELAAEIQEKIEKMKNR